MNIDNYELHLPSYSIGSQVYDQMDHICRPYGTDILIIGGNKAMAAAKEKIEAAVEKAGMNILGYTCFGTDCTFETVEKLKKHPLFEQADMIFAVGGGKALDTCKCLSQETGKPIFTFPTIASNCAACTTVAIMYNEDGTFLRPNFFLTPPIHAFIDTEIIAQAPEKYMWAGIGDTYAKYYEAEISSRGEQLPHYTAMGVNSSKMCLEPLLLYAVKGYEDNKNKICSYELEQTVLAIVVTTAVASIFLTRDFTPDYNSGMAHAVFYALTTLPVIEEKHLHGEVVGYGVLLALLVDGQKEEFEKIYRLNKQIGLPVCLSDIDVTPDEFDKIMEMIPQMSDVNHYPYRITDEMLRDALNYLEDRKKL